uniref:Galectin n=1 Tax=Meloidogyne incognita TaxID=6306 RepID=A0A914NSC4_MELIC
MKLITLLLLIICASFMVTIIEAEEPTTPPPFCRFKHIDIPYPSRPAIIDLWKLEFGPGFINPDKRIRFTGVYTNTSERFIINLYSDGIPDETAITIFHFNPRFDERQVVCNRWSPTNGWGTEVRDGGFPFKIGEPFVLDFISAPQNGLHVHIDGKPFLSFYKKDLPRLSLVEVSSAVELSSVQLCYKEPFCPGHPIVTDLTVPLTIDFAKLGYGTGFAPPKRIIILGTPLAEPESFSINIGEPGQLFVDANVLFHFSLSFNETQFILNTWIVGKGWEVEYRYRPKGFDFKVGESFFLEILPSSNNWIHVFVNGNAFGISRYDLSKVSQMSIEGDIQVSKVILCEQIKM